jgi:predicted enzyme related to lactoylglutathione lyase
MAAEIVHIEFKSANFTRTTEFYARLFDWRTEQNASASYMKLSGDGAPSGGWVRADLVQAPGPIAYLAVDDLAAKLKEVEEAGGRVLVHSLPFAGGGEIGLFADPDGNIMGLWHRKDGAAGAAAAGAGTATTGTTPARSPAVASKPAARAIAKPAVAGKATAAKKPAKKK